MIPKKIAFLILNYNGREIIEQCLPSVLAAAKVSPVSCEVHVVDNRSTDGSIEMLGSEYPEVITYIASKNDFLFSYNEYLPRVDAGLVLLFNNDVKVEEDFLAPLIKYFEDDSVFMVTPKMMEWDGSAYQNGLNVMEMPYGIPHFEARSDKVQSRIDRPQETFYSFNALYDRKKLIELGGFDKLYSPFAWEDVDICYRASKRGWKNLYEPQSVVYHYGEFTIKKFSKKNSQSPIPSRRVITRRNRLMFFWKNVRDPWLWVQHLFFMPLRLVWSIFSDRAMITAFFWALKKYFLKKRDLTFSTVISFSSLDEPFIDACVDGVLPASGKVVCVTYDKLFDGQDISGVIEKIKARNSHKTVEWIVLPLPPNRGGDTNRFYHNNLRHAGFEAVKNTADFTLFLDGDEVAEPDKLLAWKNECRTRANSIRLACYWYFREPVFRSKTTEETPIMVRNSRFQKELNKDTELLINHPRERGGYEFKPLVYVKEVMFHHYSWVRTKEEMQKKVRNWGHRNQKDWESLVEDEFSREFNGTDFVHGYEYETVENTFGIEL
ncbi:MAG: glycosyltransferase [Candidatus Margulisiibacteriota bacterium]